MKSGRAIKRGLTLGTAVLVLAPAAAFAGLAPVTGSKGLPNPDPFFGGAGNGGYEADSYNLRLRYQPRSDRLQALARIKANVQTGAGPLARFNLDYRGPRISNVRVNGARARFTRRGPELRIRPADPVADGGQLRIVVRYAGRPRQVRDPDGSSEGWTPTDDGAVALGEPLGSTSWFPSNNHPTDKATYRISISAPNGRLGISNGELAQRRKGRRFTTTVWRQAQPMASYLALVAIGRFELRRGTVAGVPYLGAADRREAGALGALRERTVTAHGFLGDLLGDYPFGATGGLIDLAPQLPYALETQARSYYPGPGAPSIGLVVHEVSHQWFGDSVSLASWDEIWLNEGFATYMEWLYQEQAGGPSANSTFQGLYDDHGAGDDGFWNPPPGDPGSPRNLFDNTVYVRGAMALHALRRTIGLAEFEALLAAWAQDNEYGNVTTDDFIALAKATADEPDAEVQAVFDDWVYSPGKPAPLPDGRRSANSTSRPWAASRRSRRSPRAG